MTEKHSKIREELIKWFNQVSTYKYYYDDKYRNYLDELQKNKHNCSDREVEE